MRGLDNGRVPVRCTGHLLVGLGIGLHGRHAKLVVTFEKVVGRLGLGHVAMFPAPDLRTHMAGLRLERQRVDRLTPRGLYREDLKGKRTRRLGLEGTRHVETRTTRRLCTHDNGAPGLITEGAGRIIPPQGKRPGPFDGAHRRHITVQHFGHPGRTDQVHPVVALGGLVHIERRKWTWLSTGLGILSSALRTCRSLRTVRGSFVTQDTMREQGRVGILVVAAQVTEPFGSL